MNERARELLASINGEAVGTLRDIAGSWSFDYAPAWIESPQAFDIAPGLPRKQGSIADGGTDRPVQWFFDNLLPENAARDVLARDARVDSADAFGLLAYYGRESAGAITLLPPGEPLADATGYQALTDEELHERIARLPRQALSAGAPKRMSLAGAQHKMAVSVRNGRLYHPVGASPSTHILKPNHSDSDDYPSSAANEYFVMTLASRMGLEVPAIELRHVPDSVYVIERFDRSAAAGQPLRHHSIDACQLLNLDSTFKYQRSRVETLVRCIDLCENRARSRQSLLQWSLFNVMVGNGDAHLKNLSFLVNASGIRLAPFYDLVSTESYRTGPDELPRWPRTLLSMPIGAAETFAQVTREEFLKFAAALGSGSRATLRLIAEFCDTLEGVAAESIDAFAARDFPDPATRAAELRVLNTIRFAVIRSMTTQMRRA